jgi:alkylation response protein AidB-like acyl-CoA dehydrogenase
VEIATRYTSMRKAFGLPIMSFQGVSFKVADCVTLLDACRSGLSPGEKSPASGEDHLTAKDIVATVASAPPPE